MQFNLLCQTGEFITLPETIRLQHVMVIWEGVIISAAALSTAQLFAVRPIVFFVEKDETVWYSEQHSDKNRQQKSETCN